MVTEDKATELGASSDNDFPFLSLALIQAQTEAGISS